MKNKCLLCQLENDNEQAIVFESNYCYFLMKKQTVLLGSGIIIPKAHKENVFELSKEEWEDTYILLKKVKNYLDEHYQPDGYNVGWNSGKIAGQSISHAHLHIIPRYKKEEHAGKGIRYWLKNQTINE